MYACETIHVKRVAFVILRNPTVRLTEKDRPFSGFGMAGSTTQPFKRATRVTHGNVDRVAAG